MLTGLELREMEYDVTFFSLAYSTTRGLFLSKHLASANLFQDQVPTIV